MKKEKLKFGSSSRKRNSNKTGMNKGNSEIPRARATFYCFSMECAQSVVFSLTYTHTHSQILLDFFPCVAYCWSMLNRVADISIFLDRQNSQQSTDEQRKRNEITVRRFGICPCSLSKKL